MNNRSFILDEATIVGIKIVDKNTTEVTLQVKRANPQILGKVVNLQEHQEEAW